MAPGMLPPGGDTLLLDRPERRVEVDPRANRALTTISAPVAGGMTSGGGSYPSGSVVTVYATFAAGYHFVNWTYSNGLEASKLAKFTFNLTADTQLTAHFAPGEIDGTPPPAYYTHGLPNNIVNSLYSCVEGENAKARIRREYYGDATAVLPKAALTPALPPNYQGQHPIIEAHEATHGSHKSTTPGEREPDAIVPDAAAPLDRGEHGE
jgi:hypothetical protein